MYMWVSGWVSVFVRMRAQQMKVKFSLFSFICAGDSKLVLIFFIILKLKGKYVSLIWHWFLTGTNLNQTQYWNFQFYIKSSHLTPPPPELWYCLSWYLVERGILKSWHRVLLSFIKYYTQMFVDLCIIEQHARIVSLTM
jgi:hypothetical protein